MVAVHRFHSRQGGTPPVSDRAPCAGAAAGALRALPALQEFLPTVLALQMALGLAYPRTAAALGLAWSLGRVVYALGQY